MTQLRYVITRPCLLEGSLTIAKYLRPIFPAELAGQVLGFRDDQGRDYSVRMTMSGGSLVGLGTLYHALRLNVNDMLLLERVGPKEYLVQGVTKPYSRPQGGDTYGSRLAEFPQRRVVVAATPHVREVRLERDFADYDRAVSGLPALLEEAYEVPEEAESPAAPPAEPIPDESAAAPIAPQINHPQAVRVDSLRLEGGHLEAPPEASVSAPALATGEYVPPSRIEAVRPSGRVEARLDAPNRQQGGRGVGRTEARRLEASRSEMLPATRVTEIRQGESRPNFRDEMLRAEANRQEVSRVEAVRGEARQGATRLALEDGPEDLSSPLCFALEGEKVDDRPTARLADVLVRGTAAAPSTEAGTVAGPLSPSYQGARVTERLNPERGESPARSAAGSLESASQQLIELARLTGYELEHLGGPDLGPVRLRAELGAHSYDVLLALNEQELRHPAFSQGSAGRPTHRALLTWEVENVSGVPRFTREALTALLEHARLAPLTPIDLRGYWNTPSFDINSVASVAELVSAYLAQRGTFTYVLSTLAQQPAHSLVDPQRLAERLGSGVNVGELRTVLETLSRPPFMALLPLQGGQYYLRAEVAEVLSELSSYTAGVARRLQGGRRK